MAQISTRAPSDFLTKYSSKVIRASSDLIGCIFITFVSYRFSIRDFSDLLTIGLTFFALFLGYASLLFNRTRSTEIRRLRVRTFVAAELATRGVCAYIISLTLMLLLNIIINGVMQLERIDTKLVKAPTWDVWLLMFISLNLSLGFLFATDLIGKSLGVLLHRDMSIMSGRDFLKLARSFEKK